MKEKLSESLSQLKEGSKHLIQGSFKYVQRLHDRVEDLIVEHSVFSKDQVESLEGMISGGVLISAPLLISGIILRSPLLLAYGIVAAGSVPGAMALLIASDDDHVFRANNK